MVKYNFDGYLEGVGTSMYQLLANPQISLDVESSHKGWYEREKKDVLNHQFRQAKSLEIIPKCVFGVAWL